MSKPKLKWAEKGEAEDFDAAVMFLSLLFPNSKAKALVRSLRNSKLIEHAPKDLLRAAHLPLLPSDESHVSEDLKRIQRGQAARARASRPRRHCDRTSFNCGGRLSPDLCCLLFRRERANSMPNCRHRQPLATRMISSPCRLRIAVSRLNAASQDHPGFTGVYRLSASRTRGSGHER